MTKRLFEVEFTGMVVLELDDAVIDAVDDDWRKVLYDLQTPEEIADMVAFNLVINGYKLSGLDGWSNQPDENAKIVEDADWDTYVKAVETQ